MRRLKVRTDFLDCKIRIRERFDVELLQPGVETFPRQNVSIQIKDQKNVVPDFLPISLLDVGTKSEDPFFISRKVQLVVGQLFLPPRGFLWPWTFSG